MSVTISEIFNVVIKRPKISEEGKGRRRFTGITGFSDLFATRSREARRANARIALFGVSLLANTAVLARIQSARFASRDTTTGGGLTN